MVSWFCLGMSKNLLIIAGKTFGTSNTVKKSGALYQKVFEKYLSCYVSVFQFMSVLSVVENWKLLK